jgi:hypothetical protein
MSRREFAERYIEPNYVPNPNINVVGIRNLFAEISKIVQSYGETTITAAGGDPESKERSLNTHFANTHHTRMMANLDVAKDEFVKWIFACSAVMAEEECVTEDPIAAKLFAESAERKRRHVE